MDNYLQEQQCSARLDDDDDNTAVGEKTYPQLAPSAGREAGSMTKAAKKQTVKTLLQSEPRHHMRASRR